MPVSIYQTNNNNPSNIYRMNTDDIPLTSMTDKCLVLDLDQTLIATQEDVDDLKSLKILTDPKQMELRKRTYYLSIDDIGAPGEGSRYDFWGVTRPHIDEFLIFCFSYFKIVGVCSAGKRPYVEAICDHLFRNIRPPHFMYSYDDLDWDEKNRPIKRLTKIINSNNILKKHMTLENTLALDDYEITFSKNRGNGVLIPEYIPDTKSKPKISTLSRDEHSLLQFKYWLLQPEVMKCSDVTTLNKVPIFTTPLNQYKSKLSVSGYHFL